MNNVPGYILFYGDLGYYMICDRLDNLWTVVARIPQHNGLESVGTHLESIPEGVNA